MKELIGKIFAVFAIIVFTTMLINHGAIRFEGVDWAADKALKAINSDQGQALIEEAKDTSYDVATTLTKGISKRAKNIAITEATLLKVVDGDTIIVNDNPDEDNYYVRLIGIDTPESVNPDETLNNSFGDMASEFTKNLLKDVKTVYLQYDIDVTDKYDRVLAYVWLDKEKISTDTQNIANYMVNGIILRNGYAIDKVYKPNVRYADTFAELREDAQAEKAGLWEYDDFAKLWE